LIAAFLVVALLSPAAYGAATYDPDAETSLQRGTITDPANGTTVVSVQGFTFQGKTNRKKPARLVAVGPRGDTEWVHTSAKGSQAWFYDVDPLPGGNLLVVSPRSGHTVVYEYDPRADDRVWTQRLPYTDTHDVDMLDEHRMVVANMRQWNETASRSDDRVVIYNRTSDEVTWEWYFREHYPNDTDGGMNEDWTHFNDVDVIDEHRLLLSPRNFDQVVILNRTTGEIEDRLGSDDAHEILDEQHNPDYLESDDGTPTILVADSENNRVVEYAKDDGEWVRTWEVGTGQLNWPRDADRLPNGNTLITDTLNHRVIEVTPTGEIVWEYYATWGPFDAERIVHGDGSHGPTIRDLNASGTYELSGSAGLRPGTGDRLTFAATLRAAAAGTPLQGPVATFANRWSHTVPWVRPVWLTSWQFVFAVAAGLVALAWGIAELALARDRLAARFRTAVRQYR
jgi:hypothetical protein